MFCYEPGYELSEEEDSTSMDIENVNNFLALQNRLEKLVYRREELPWNRLTCFQLKELGADFLPFIDNDGHERDAIKFLKKLPNLTTLDIRTYDNLTRPLMEVICQIPQLEKLTFRENSVSGNHFEYNLGTHVNQTVKKLQIIEEGSRPDITGILLKIFLGVESVYLGEEAHYLDLSDVQNETIKKIKHHSKCSDEVCR